jgi:hypothetical protein
LILKEKNVERIHGFGQGGGKNVCETLISCESWLKTSSGNEFLALANLVRTIEICGDDDNLILHRFIKYR